MVGKELGKGQFGVTHLARDRRTGEEVAIKSIAKRQLQCKEEVEDIRYRRVQRYLECHLVLCFAALQQRAPFSLVALVPHLRGQGGWELMLVPRLSGVLGAAGEKWP